MRRRDVPSALITHPEHLAFFRRFGRVFQPMDIPASCVEVARSQGWIVIGTDTEVLDKRLFDVPAQSNPHRESHGYGVVRDNDETEER